MTGNICDREDARAFAATLLSLTEDCPTARALTECFIERPQLMPVLQERGGWSLAEYGESLISTDGTFSPAIRGILQDIGSQRFGPEMGELLQQDGFTFCSIDTAGHGGILSEDTLVQGHVLGAHGILSKGGRVLISLSCGVVPMNNSTWPRGFYIGGKRESIFSKAFDKTAYHECPAFNAEQLQRVLKLGGDASRMASIIERTPGIFSVPLFHQQAGMINHLLWREAFGSEISLFSCMLEEVTSRLIRASIERRDLLFHLLFDSQMREEVLVRLSDLPGTWRTQARRGTHFFWYRSGDVREASLWLEGDLFTRQGETLFQCNPEQITSALSSGEIVPGVFLSLLSLLLHGARCLGGYHQIWYLPEYRARLDRLAREVPRARDLGEIDPSELLAQAGRVNMSYGPVFTMDDVAAGVPAGIDFFLRHRRDLSHWGPVLRSVTVARGSAMNLDRWYREIVPKRAPVDAAPPT